MLYSVTRLFIFSVILIISYKYTTTNIKTLLSFQVN